MKNTAIYTGSFDPPTKGHLWMIEQSARLFEKVVVAIGVNSEKKTMFPLQDRMAMLVEITKHLPNVSIEAFEGKLAVSYAKRQHAKFMVRGIRNAGDFEYERMMRNVNTDLDKEIETVFLIPPRELAEVSSSLVRGLISSYGWERIIGKFVPEIVAKKMKKSIDQSALIPEMKEKWVSLCARLGVKNDIEKIFEDLVERYGESHRRYHTLSHIAQMLREFEDLRHLAKNPEAVEFAIWLHDVIYDTHAKDNELESAALAKACADEMGLDIDFGIEVFKMVAATDHKEPARNINEKILFDLDLATLASEPEAFDRNSANIREEYGWVPEAIFKQKRAEFAEGILSRAQIYSLPVMREKYEAKARANLERHVAALRA